jgi:hypothetical protein
VQRGDNWIIDMGTRNGPYNADFPLGTLVRVKPREFLETFLPASIRCSTRKLPQQIANNIGNERAPSRRNDWEIESASVFLLSKSLPPQ